jgi:hypothetical protein
VFSGLGSRVATLDVADRFLKLRYGDGFRNSHGSLKRPNLVNPTTASKTIVFVTEGKGEAIDRRAFAASLG